MISPARRKKSRTQNRNKSLIKRIAAQVVDPQIHASRNPAVEVPASSNALLLSNPEPLGNNSLLESVKEWPVWKRCL